MTDGNEQIKEQVFGAVRKPQKTKKKFFVDQETVNAPLVLKGSVVRACCLGCGKVLELLEQGALKLTKLAGTNKPESFNGHYFVADQCPLCGKEYRNVSLKTIEG